MIGTFHKNSEKVVKYFKKKIELCQFAFIIYIKTH